MSKSNPDKSFGHRFWVMVKESPFRDYTQLQIANMFGVRQTTVSEWLQGNKRPQVTLGKTICKAFDTSFDWLYTGTGPMRQEKPKEDPITQMAKAIRMARPSNAKIALELLNTLESVDTHSRIVHNRVVLSVMDNLENLLTEAKDTRVTGRDDQTFQHHRQMFNRRKTDVLYSNNEHRAA